MKDLKDVTEKLHSVNKARHDTEIRLSDSKEENKGINDILKLNNEIMLRKDADFGELEKQYHDLRKNYEHLDIKKQGIERDFRLNQKQLNEKISNLNNIIEGEQETRKDWVDRYEREAKDH